MMPLAVVNVYVTMGSKERVVGGTPVKYRFVMLNR
jgi:hypothetical protein